MAIPGPRRHIKEICGILAHHRHAITIDEDVHQLRLVRQPHSNGGFLNHLGVEFHRSHERPLRGENGCHRALGHAYFQRVRESMPPHQHSQRPLRLRHFEAQRRHAPVALVLQLIRHRAPIEPFPASRQIGRIELQPLARAQRHEKCHLPGARKTRGPDIIIGIIRTKPASFFPHPLVFDPRIRFAGNAALKPELPRIRRAGHAHQVTYGGAGSPHRPRFVVRQPRQANLQRLYLRILHPVVERQARQGLSLAHRHLLQCLHRHPWLQRFNRHGEPVILLQQPEGDHSRPLVSGCLGIDLRHILTCHRTQPDAPLRHQEDIPALAGCLANLHSRHCPLRLRARRRPGQRDGECLFPHRPSRQLQRDNPLPSFIGLRPLAERRAGERLHVQPVGQRKA